MVSAIRVLCVDDNQEFLRALEGYLKGLERVEVVGTLTSGEEAVAVVPVLRPDLVLMDIAMPGMGGLEATRVIKSADSPPKVVLITLYDTEEYRKAAQGLRVDGFVPKSELVSSLAPLIDSLFQEKEEEMGRKNPPGGTVLIVDDSRTIRKMVRASLEALGPVEFLEAQNGLEAIEKMALTQVDLMVLDLNMPDMNGMEVLTFIKSRSPYSKTPILVLTTKGDKASMEEALSRGADHYMTKPFNPGELLVQAKRLLYRGKESS